MKLEYHDVWSELMQFLLTEPFHLLFQCVIPVLEVEMSLNKAHKETGVLSPAAL